MKQRWVGKNDPLALALRLVCVINIKLSQEDLDRLESIFPVNSEKSSRYQDGFDAEM